MLAFLAFTTGLLAGLIGGYFLPRRTGKKKEKGEAYERNLKLMSNIMNYDGTDRGQTRL